MIETNNVVERLRRVASPGYVRHTATNTFSTNTLYVNPDGPAAIKLIQSLSDHIDVLEAEKASIPEGAAFFKALKHGATFKWMELVQADAPQARIDAQSDLQVLLAAVAKKVEEIEALDASLTQGGKNV